MSLSGLKRLLVGKSLPTSAHADERLTNAAALAVLSSDALSSVAYATEEILLILVTAGSAALSYSVSIAGMIMLLLAILVVSYNQTIKAYPNSGGAYIVAKDNLGLIPGLVAGGSLMIDYILTAIQTGNQVVAQFAHIESRELDPHLHTHALVMNLTQAENGKWYANDNDLIFQNKKHLGTIYQAYLAAEVERQGYEIEPRPHGMFEIKGYKLENLIEFSKRRMQILAQCPANSTWQTREDSWDRTRKHKEHIASTELKARWQQEASDLGIEIVSAGVLTVAQPISLPTAQQYLDDAIARCSERSVDFRVEDIEKFVIAQRLPLDIADIKSLCDARPDLIKLDRHYTTFKAQIQSEVSDSAADGIALRLPSSDTPRSARLQGAFHQADPTLLFSSRGYANETLRERELIQVEPLLDNVNESEAELDKQEGVKVPTYGGGVKVPTHGGDVCIPTSRNFDNSYQATSVTNL
jgi:TrwC relaxase